ncbi:GNAT family N-acetyltransferase [Paenibacillus sp. FSL M8-0334]|uniref:GNAT family N-acetyltransferase n=2 Tax=Paenibacillus TaxID=44249 RepID=A0A268ET99_9BACL|nr:GNAT family N-acetyltransferase [Paenibacillus campinasensis]MUG68912.1 GNAT family N-acetyltransferase [Paenibacillus campinasensis]PAD76349.1 GNAT family N-acetyltransferase [Paenibacillus campinasensis]
MRTLPIDPLLLDFPESFESERLLIRAPLWGDGAAVNEAVRESVEELRPWMPWAQTVPTIEESELSIRRARVHFLERKDMRLHLVHKDTGQLIGSSGLHRMNWKSRSFEIGYWVRTSCQQQGYITEAVHAITHFAIRELQASRIEIRCDSRNTRSRRVAERAGFTLDGILRQDMLDVQGALRDTMVFSKVRGVEF